MDAAERGPERERQLQGERGPEGERETKGERGPEGVRETKGEPEPERDDPAPVVAGRAAPRAAAAPVTGGRLLAQGDGDKLSLRLQNAVGGFVDAPKSAVEDVDQVVKEIASRVTEALTQRRRTLHTSWKDEGDKERDTEELRLVLRDYRDLAERLLRL